MSSSCHILLLILGVTGWCKTLYTYVIYKQKTISLERGDSDVRSSYAKSLHYIFVWLWHVLESHGIWCWPKRREIVMREGVERRKNIAFGSQRGWGNGRDRRFCTKTCPPRSCAKNYWLNSRVAGFGVENQGKIWTWFWTWNFPNKILNLILNLGRSNLEI